MNMYTVTIVNDPDKPPVRRAISARNGRIAVDKVMSVWHNFDIQYEPDYRSNGIVGRFEARRIMPGLASYAGTVAKGNGCPDWCKLTPLDDDGTYLPH